MKKLFLFFGILILTIAVVVGFVMLKPDGNNDNTDDITSDTSSTEEVEENLPTATYFYPEYPEYTENGELILPRDYDYEVYVNDGESETQIPVYNTARNITTFVTNTDGSPDNERRFCEFSFRGTVTVKVKVKGRMLNYAVLPSSEFSPSDSSYDETTGVISITLTQPKNFLVRLNDDDKTTLCIFAEKLWTEAEVPKGNNVVVFQAGYHDMVSNSEGAYINPGEQEWYLMPGAIVNARVRINAYAKNVVIGGRGSFVDPRTDRNNKSLTNIFFAEYDENVTLKGVKFLDAHCFNLCFTSTTGITVDDVKIISSEISTDGITFWGQCSGVVKNTFLYVNDNAFVVSGNEIGGLKIQDCVVGNGHAILYPQGTITDLTLENIDIFRMADLFAAREEMVSKNPVWNILMKNIRAQDCLSAYNIVLMQKQGISEKKVTFQNVSLPEFCNYVYDADNMSSNITFVFKDVFLGDKRINSASRLNINPNAMDYNFEFEKTGTTLDSFGGGKFPFARQTAFHVPDPVIIVGHSNTLPYYKITVDKKDDKTVYIPVAYVLEKAGYTVKVEDNGAKVTATDDESIITLTETSASNKKFSKKPEMSGTIMMVPTSLMYEVYGLKCNVDSSGNVLVQANEYKNLLKDPGFEKISHTGNMLLYEKTRHYAKSFDWLDFYHAYLYRETTNVRSGESSIKIGTRKEERGVAQNIGDIIRTYGPGKYVLKAYIKLGENATENTIARFGLGITHWSATPEGSKMTGYTYEQLSKEEWTLVESTVIFDEEMVANADKYEILITGRDTSVAGTDDGYCFYVDDASLEFFPYEKE